MLSHTFAISRMSRGMAQGAKRAAWNRLLCVLYPLGSPSASDLEAASNAAAAAARSASVARRSPRRSASVSSIARIA